MIALITSALLAAVVGNTELSVEERARAAEVYNYAFESIAPHGLDSSRIQNLSESDRDLVIRWLRIQGGGSSEGMGTDKAALRRRGRSGVEYKLAILGDEWGLRDFAERVHENPRAEWRSRFRTIRNAKIISMVGDLLFRTEKMEWSDDLGFIPSQWTAAQGIIETLKYAPQFQPDVWQWGQELEDAWSKPGGDVINILREWYRENEGKLRAGKFDEVRAGRHPVVKAKTEPPVPTPVPSASDPVPENASSTQQNESAKERRSEGAKERRSEGAKERRSEGAKERKVPVGASFRGYLGGAVGCLALIIVLRFWGRRH